MRIACFSTAFSRGLIPAGETVRCVSHFSLVCVMLWMTLVNPAHADGNVDPYIATADYWSQQWCDSGCVTPQPPSHGNLCEIAGGVKTTPDEACRALKDAYIKTQICRGVPPASLETGYGVTATANPECFLGSSTGWMNTSGIVINACPDNSTPNRPINPTSCSCDTGYAPDATHKSCVSNQCLPPNVIDPKIGKCGPKCTVDPLPDLPKDDLCAQSIEAGRGKDVKNACSSKLLPEMQKQAQCLADKIHALGQAYTGPSATVRTAAYQKHLLEVWNKSIEIENKDLSDEEELACAAVIANAENEKDWHKIKSDPSSKGSEAPHVLGKAIDIPMGVVDALKARVSNTTFVTITGCIFCIPIAVTTIGDIQDYVNSATVNPPACNLKWGGRFRRIDDVHFQLP